MQMSRLKASTLPGNLPFSYSYATLSPTFERSTLQELISMAVRLLPNVPSPARRAIAPRQQQPKMDLEPVTRLDIVGRAVIRSQIRCQAIAQASQIRARINC
jgi:hypothetical protein